MRAYVGLNVTTVLLQWLVLKSRALIQVLDHVNSVVVHRASATVQCLADFTVTTDTPIPFLTLTTAIADRLTLNAAFHAAAVATAAATATAASRLFKGATGVTRHTRWQYLGIVIAISSRIGIHCVTPHPSQVLFGFLLTQG
jgi:hypothetical protein